MNALAGSNFEPELFAHRAFWNAAERRVEMWLMARRPMTVDDLMKLRNVGEAVLGPDGVQIVYVVSVADPAAGGYNSDLWLVSTTGGTLITCTCSYHMSEQMFQDLLAAAAADARRRVQIIEKRMQARDHPVLVGVPETLYLKCLLARVVD